MRQSGHVRDTPARCGVGITGGEEDGVDNEDANPEDLYSKPEEIWQVCAEAAPAAGVSRRRVTDPLHGVFAGLAGV